MTREQLIALEKKLFRATEADKKRLAAKPYRFEEDTHGYVTVYNADGDVLMSLHKDALEGIREYYHGPR